MVNLLNKIKKYHKLKSELIKYCEIDDFYGDIYDFTDKEYMYNHGEGHICDTKIKGEEYWNWSGFIEEEERFDLPVYSTKFKDGYFIVFIGYRSPESIILFDENKSVPWNEDLWDFGKEG